jgi:predicted MFS family arabinose efflux permease
LVFYPLAGFAGARWGMPVAFVLLGLAAALALAVAWRVWPVQDPDVIEHDHDDGTHHAHLFWIDDQHPHWPHGRRPG